MHEFQERPLGAQVPDSPHAVCVHLPTIRDVIGYEEKRPDVLEVLRGGYPRFVRHPFILRLGELLKEQHHLENRLVSLVASRRAALELEDYVLDDSGEWLEVNGPLFLYHCEDTEENRIRCRDFLQHTGCSISSRFAEDRLLDLGVLDKIHEEKGKEEKPGDLVRQELSKALKTGRPDSVLLCNSGMNAFYSVYKAVRDFAREEGRGLWIQLGWVYLDTTKVIERFSDSTDQSRIFFDVQDKAAVEQYLERHGSRVAGCITEVPTNPLLQTVDLVWLRELADRYEFFLILDPSMASPYNVDVMPYADIVVNSLTKYTAVEGDVIMGAAVFNTTRPMARELLARTVSHHEPPYRRDLERIAAQVESFPAVMRQINKSAALVADFLENHSRVSEVYWPYARQTRNEYETICRWPIGPGGVLTFTTTLPLAEFYDRCPLVKGPSFGTRFSILCPYLYLAHYDLVASETGRRVLESAGLNPDLVRLSIGLESAEWIIQALKTGLGSDY